MENTDDSRRKPRRTRGTPAYQYRNKFALAWIVLGSAVFATWAYTPFFQKANKRLCDKLLCVTQEEIDRRYMFSLPNPQTSTQIQKRIDEEKELLSQR